MKKFILLFLITLNVFAAQSKYDLRVSAMEQELGQVYKQVIPMDENTKLERALEARKIFDNQELDSTTRINANLVYSGFIGLYAQSKRSEEFGKKSYYALKENFKLDPKNKKASMALADAILGIYDSAFCFIVKRRYGIENMNNDLNFAINNLKQFLPESDARLKIERLEKVSF